MVYNSFKKASLLLLLPTLEYFFLRIFLHTVLGVRLGFANTTDWDFLVPVPISFFLLVYSLELAKPVLMRFSGRNALLNILFVGLFLLLNANYLQLTYWSPGGTVAAWFLCLVVIAFTSISVFVDLRSVLTHPHRIAILPCMLIGSSLYIYQNAFRPVWMGLGYLTAETLHFLFQHVPWNGATSVFTPEEAVRIDHPLLSVRISRGCGGGDAFFYFSLVFLLVKALSTKPLGWVKSIGFYVGGVVLMFCLNLLRIVLLIFAGIYLKQYLGPERGLEIFKVLFHIHIGWILYSFGIFSYLALAARLLKMHPLFLPQRIPAPT